MRIQQLFAPPVELNAENGLIEMLQLRHREPLWQQLKTCRFEAN